MRNNFNQECIYQIKHIPDVTSVTSVMVRSRASKLSRPLISPLQYLLLIASSNVQWKTLVSDSGDSLVEYVFNSMFVVDSGTFVNSKVPSVGS